MIWLRSLLFFIGMSLVTIVCCAGCMIGLLLPYRVRYEVISFWCRACLILLRWTCGLSGQVLGRENLPNAHAAVVMCKHQSAWETIIMPPLIPRQSWVVKRELLWLPFFGWGLWSLRPIAIDRSKHGAANRQLMEQGTDRLRQGSSVIIFPEGTRIPAGQRGKYKAGGARLACAAGVPVVPIAVNSGEFWPRNGFLKYPGQITLSVGPPIETTGKTPEQVIEAVEHWIESEVARISGVGPCWPGPRR